MNTKKLSTDRFVVIIGIISMIYIVVSRFWKLNKGLIFNDEGWYVVLLRDNPAQNLVSRFYKLFQFGLQNDIFALRLICCVLLLGAIVLFGYSVFKLQRHLGQNYSFIFCLSVVAIGSLQAHSISTPNYINMNLFFGLLAISFFMLWISQSKWFYLVASSFLASFLFTTQALGIILLPVLFILLFFFSKKKWLDSLYFISGIILFLGFYFLIEPPTELFCKVLSTAKRTAGKVSGDYGLAFLIRWSIVSVSYITKFLVGAFVFYQIIIYLKHKRLSCFKKNLLYVCAFGAIFIYLNVFITPHCHKSSIIHFHQLGFPYFLLFLVLWSNIHNLNLKQILLISLLAFMPFALCLGTNTTFFARYSTFLVFLLPPVFILAKPSDEMKKLAIAYYLFTLLVSIATFNKPNWMGERPLDQNIPVKSIGINQNISLTERNINQLRFCQDNIDKSTPCFSSSQTWGIVSLLDYYPLDYRYRLPENEQLLHSVYKNLGNHKQIVIISTDKDSLNLSNYEFREDIIHTEVTGEGIVLDFFNIE